MSTILSFTVSLKAQKESRLNNVGFVVHESAHINNLSAHAIHTWCDFFFNILILCRRGSVLVGAKTKIKVFFFLKLGQNLRSNYAFRVMFEDIQYWVMKRMWTKVWTGWANDNVFLMVNSLPLVIFVQCKAVFISLWHVVIWLWHKWIENLADYFKM